MAKIVDPDLIRADYALTRSKTATARRLGLHRETVAKYVSDADLALPEPLTPGPGPVQRYLLTSAQNNTAIHEAFWENLQAYAKHLNAQILVGGFIYCKNARGQREQEKEAADENEEAEQWDARLEPYRSDKRKRLSSDLVWMGQMNTLPTNVDPLSGLHGYSRGDSAVYPHVKVAMRTIPTAPDAEPKFLYTTGAVTLPNYIQRKSGQVAEFHHVIGALIVEVEGDQWFARQINATDDGAFQDVDAIVRDGRVTTGNHVFAVNWGDIHVAKLRKETAELHWGPGGILDQLRPVYQFFHDLVDAQSANPHDMGDHLRRYALDRQNLNDIRAELDEVAGFLNYSARPGLLSVVVPANHDDMILRWLKTADHRREPKNMRFYHEASLAALDMIDRGEGVDLTAWYLKPRAPDSVVFIPPNKPTFIHLGIEFGQHGHIGPNGNRKPSAKAYAMLAVKVNKGHEHTASIYDGIYTAGVMELEHGYNIGYSSWSVSHILTYPNGKRAIITVKGNKWRATT